MTEKELIGNLRQLRQIKPSKDWASFNKRALLGEEAKPFFFPYWKPAFAGVLTIFIMFGAYGLVKNSMPGDTLYTLKKIAKTAQQAIFVSEEEKPAFQLKLANDRLEDLAKASAKNLAPTINEFQANISEAVENLGRMDGATTSPMAIINLIEESQKLSENTEKARALGVVISEEETTNLDKVITEYLIDYLDGRTLTEEKENVLKEMKQLVEDGKYREALETYLLSQ